jgi:hypothetical protein
LKVERKVRKTVERNKDNAEAQSSLTFAEIRFDSKRREEKDLTQRSRRSDTEVAEKKE